MSTIYEFLGFLFRIYSNDHLPVHMHVIKDGRENKCELHYHGDDLFLKWRPIARKPQLTSKEMKTAEKFIYKYNLEIVEKWNLIQIYKKPVKKQKIDKL